MQNTSCPLSCDPPVLTRQTELFGKSLTCKGYCCSRDGGPYLPKPEKLQLQLSVCPTSYCPASCPFCIAWPGTAERRRLDPEKLGPVLRELRARDIVRGVSITGGEPFLDVPLLNRVVNLLFDVFGEHLEVTLNTNGMAISRIRELEMLSYIDAIHISRHHYDDRINSRIFGMELPDNAELSSVLHSVSFRDIFVLNCILMKDAIGTPEEAHRFLDFAIGAGAGKVCFITAAPVNDFIRRQALNYDEVLREDDPRLLFTQSYRDYELCRCQDGVYVSPSGELIEFYGRRTGATRFSYVRGLVYDADDHLRAGFGGEIIL